MFFEKKHPIKADADLTNRMLRILATGNGNRLQKCLKTMFFEKKHPIKADADLTNRMLRILATGNGNRLQKCLKTMFFEKNTRLLTKSSQNSLIIFTLQAQKKQFISFSFF